MPRLATCFTHNYLRSLAAGPKARDVSDPSTRGLVIRLWPWGAKTWLFRYKWRQSAVRLSLGNFPDISLQAARTVAIEFQRLIKDGIDPRKSDRPLKSRSVRAKQKNVPAPVAESMLGRSDGRTEPNAFDMVLDAEAVSLDAHSFEFLAREFYRRYIIPNRHAPEYVKRILKAELLPRWSGRDARTIKPREVIDLLDGIVDRGSRVMANRVSAVTAQLFLYGIQRSIVEDSPVKLLCQPGGKEKPKKRTFSTTELQAFVKGMDKACRSQQKGRVLMLLLLTLQRRSEIGLAEWREFNFRDRTWHIPDEHARKYRGHILPLTDWAIGELMALKRMAGRSRFVLPSTQDPHRPAEPRLITRSVARSQKRFQQ